MNEVLRSLPPSDQAGPQAAEELLPLLYKELRQLAARKLAHELPGQTLQATDLVHEVYVRLVGGENPHRFDSSGHFFAAAAEAMRRILIESARSKGREKRGGDWQRVDFEELDVTTAVSPDQLVALDDAHLTHHSGLALRTEIDALATRILSGAIDPTTGETDPGAAHIADQIQQLATFDIKSYTPR